MIADAARLGGPTKISAAEDRVHVASPADTNAPLSAMTIPASARNVKQTNRPKTPNISMA